MAPGSSFRAHQSWMASIPLDSLSSVQSRLLSPLPEWLDLSRCLLVHRRVELSLDLTLALLTTNWPGNLHVPHHVSQMNLKGMLVVFGTQVSISWHPSASFLQNSLLSLLASLFVSLSRCNCSSTLLPSLDFCRASMSLMVWSKIQVFMVSGLVSKYWVCCHCYTLPHTNNMRSWREEPTKSGLKNWDTVPFATPLSCQQQKGWAVLHRSPSRDVCRCLQ